MRYGIISDIHGNLEALTATMNALDEHGVDRIVCLGDTVGYGANPNECCDIVRERADVAVLGNHDAMVVGKLALSHCHRVARRAIQYSQRHVSAENIAWLRSLDYSENEGTTRFCHGSPISVEDFDYVFSLDQAATLTGHYDELPACTFVGHSHRTTAFVVTDRISFRFHAPQFQIRSAVKYVFNVGSIGQPRDRDTRSCCVLYDTESRVVQYLRVPYDVATAATKIVNAQLPPSLGERLYYGA
jgi:predicted phosphodiesterase